MSNPRRSRNGPRVFVLVHCEHQKSGKSWMVDEVVSHVASTKKKALLAMKKIWIEPGTWWRLVTLRMDGPLGEEGDRLYSRAGRALNKQPKRPRRP